MPSVFQSFVAGQQARQTSQYQGLQMDVMKSDIKARKAQAKQTQLLGQAETAYMGGDTEAFQGLGSAGRKVQGEIETFEQEGKDRAMAELQQWGPAVMEMEPGPERDQAHVWLAQNMEKGGVIGKGVSRAFLSADPEEKERMLQALAGGDESRIPGDFKAYTKSDGTEILVNEADPEDQALLRQNRDWTPSPTKTEVRTGELPKAEATKLRDYEATTSTFIQRGNAILDLLEENPDANTVVSAFEKAGMNIMTEAKQLAEDAGFDSIEDEIKGYDEAGTSSFLEKQGITSARMKGQIVALAYMQAKIFDKGGRVTDKDFKFALEALGANNSNPKAFEATLRDQMKLAEQGFRSDYSRRMGEDYEGSFDAKKEKEVPTVANDDDYNALPSGTVFVGPDGVKRTKP